jgi:alpha-L-fucosidase
VKKRDLMRTIGRAARDANLEWGLIRQGAEHELWSLDGERVTVPRHREIDEFTARSILKALELKLGKHWWRQ